MARIVPLCSSSKGNAVFIGDNKDGVLIDAGCSYRQLLYLMNICGIDIHIIKAILITHEHSDHIKGLKQLTKQTGIPVFASAGTINEIIRTDNISPNSELLDISNLSIIESNIVVKAFRTSHDSVESIGFKFEKQGYRIGYCTDTGTITETIRDNLYGSDLVFIESNYEPKLLTGNNKYPPYLKKRIASDVGHLSNPDSAGFIKNLITTGTTRIILGHLSEENNRPEYAYNRVENYLMENGIKEGIDYTLDIAPVVSDGKIVAV